jgi:hypothetical protein
VVVEEVAMAGTREEARKREEEERRRSARFREVKGLRLRGISL